MNLSLMFHVSLVTFAGVNAMPKILNPWSTDYPEGPPCTGYPEPGFKPSELEGTLMREIKWLGWTGHHVPCGDYIRMWTTAERTGTLRHMCGLLPPLLYIHPRIYPSNGFCYYIYRDWSGLHCDMLRQDSMRIAIPKFLLQGYIR